MNLRLQLPDCSPVFFRITADHAVDLLQHEARYEIVVSWSETTNKSHVHDDAVVCLSTGLLLSRKALEFRRNLPPCSPNSRQARWRARPLDGWLLHLLLRKVNRNGVRTDRHRTLLDSVAFLGLHLMHWPSVGDIFLVAITHWKKGGSQTSLHGHCEPHHQLYGDSPNTQLFSARREFRVAVRHRCHVYHFYGSIPLSLFTFDRHCCAWCQASACAIVICFHTEGILQSHLGYPSRVV